MATRTGPLLFNDHAPLDSACRRPRLGEVHFWEIDLSAQLRCGNSIKNAKPRSMLAPYRSPVSAAARAMLRIVLSGYISVPAESLEFLHGPYGKPQLHPRHQAGLEFNLAHSGERVVIAVTTGAKVGVDIERLRPVPDWQNIVAQFFTASEQKQLFQLGPEIGWQAFIIVWTRKEAFIKATGEGLSRSLNSIEVPVNPEVRSWVLGSTDTSIGAWSMQALETSYGYACSLALEGQLRELRYMRRDHATIRDVRTKLLSGFA